MTCEEINVDIVENQPITLALEVGSQGDVIGPSSATDNAIAVFNGTTGKVIKNSTFIIVGNKLYLDFASNTYFEFSSGVLNLYVNGVQNAQWG